MTDYNNRANWATAGAHPTTAADGWISYEFAKPAARQAINGDHPFAIKKLYFKTCSAPQRSQKMYARISTPSGHVYDNSYIGNTISWQKTSKVTYGFSSINFHWTDEDGPTLRAWLVSGGPFLFDYASGGGTIKASGGKTWSGVPIGGYDWVQVALPPSHFKPVRNDKDPNRVDFTWDVLKLSDRNATGGSTSISGYVIEMAKDQDFTDGVRYAYVAKGTAAAYGLYDGYDWYFRIGTRNEVSEHYKLKCGVWGHTFKLAASHNGTPTPASDIGVTGGTETSGGSGGDTGGNNGGGTSGNSDVPPAIAALLTTAAAELASLNNAASTAQSTPSANNWGKVLQQIALLRVAVGRMLGTNVNPAEPWTTASKSLPAALVRAQAAQTAQVNLAKAKLAKGANTTGTPANAALTKAQSEADTLADAASHYVSTAASDVQSAIGSTQAPTDGTKAGYDTALAKELATITRDVAALQAAANAAQANPSTASLNKVSTAATVVNTDAVAIAAKDAHYNLSDAQGAFNLIANDAIHVVEDVEVAQLEFALSDLAVVWAAVKQVGVDLTAAKKVQAASEDGSEQTGSTSGSNTSSESGTTIFTPIPPTPAFHSAFGGLVLSRGGSLDPHYVVELRERGGRERLATFGKFDSLNWGRIRDSQSTAELTLIGKNVDRSAAAIDYLDTGQGVGRYELCVFRDEERVWEGPITLFKVSRDKVTITATDVTHYLARTVMHGAYSNAYPNLAYTVDRIGGIIANEIARKEAIAPGVNLLKWVHTYIQEGDTKTTRVTDPGAMSVWQHLDDLAARSGIDYTVVGRSLRIWDTSRAPFGRIRTVTEQDFTGDPEITVYGKELATIYFVSDGQGNFGVAGTVDDFYGEVELVAAAYDENGNSVIDDLNSPLTEVLASISQAQLEDQADKNLSGRSPTPRSLSVPAGSGFRMDRGIGLDVLVPGMYVPVAATLAGGRTMNQMLKLDEVKVTVSSSGEHVSITLAPIAASGIGDDITGTDG